MTWADPDLGPVVVITSVVLAVLLYTSAQLGFVPDDVASAPPVAPRAHRTVASLRSASIVDWIVFDAIWFR